MSIRLGMTLATAAVLAAGTLAAADTPTFDKLSDWSKNRGLTISEDGVMTLKGRRIDIYSKPFPVDPTKKYRFSMEIRRTPGAVAERSFVGNWSVSASGLRMLPEQVMAAKGTESTLAADAKKGAKEVVIVRPAGWKDNFFKLYWGLVFDAKADLSDLPNTSYDRVMSAEADGDKLKLTLQKPLDRDHAAGTAVRCHGSGNGMYGGWSNKPAPEEWTPVSWTVSGRAASGNPVTKWWANTEKGVIRIIANYNQPSSLEVRNVKMEVLD